jgi:lipopolysaccharide transport system ATP-binding protein
MTNTVISVEHLSKIYRLGQIGTGTLSRDINVWWAKARGKPNPLLRIGETDHGNRDGEELWALRDVSFTVQQGELLGIIGRNGAGKSTLLKILSRVTAPTSGKIKVKGRIASLLEVGTGFHPELTGRENIYLNGAILGMSRKEIERKFDEIVDFAEIEKFIDTPVKRYSSGMYVRLAFAVAAHLEPEILLVDEVLAVGDAKFQKKCLGKMKEVTQEGRTVLFVSHNMGAIGSICQTGILLDRGSIMFLGPMHKATSLYLGEIELNVEQVSVVERKDRSGTGDVMLTSFHIENEAGKRVERIENGRTVRLVFGYRTRYGKEEENVDLAILVRTEDGEPFFQTGTRFTGQKFLKIPPLGNIVCTLERFPLVPGNYRLDAYLEAGGNPSDYILWLARLDVVDGDYYGSGYPVYEKESKILVGSSWSCELI